MICITTTFLICHLITWLKFMLSVGWILFHRFAHSFLFETFADNVKNWYYKVRQLFQNETENSHKKIIAKSDRDLLQSALGITNMVWQKFIAKCARYCKYGVTEVYYKVRQVSQSVTGCYYKARQVLQSVTIITKWDVTILSWNRTLEHVY